MDPKLKAEIIEQLKAIDQANRKLFELVKSVPSDRDFSYSLEEIDEAVDEVIESGYLYCECGLSEDECKCAPMP